MVCVKIDFLKSILLLSYQPAMFSKILIKLIDQAIVPALLLVAVRMISVVLISNQLGIPYVVGPAGLTFNNPQHYLTINSYSILSIFVTLTIGLSYVLIKTFVFHNSHVDPQTTATIFSLRLSHFIQNSFDLYSQGVIWISYLYLMLLMSGVMALFGLLFPWVFYTGLVLGVITTIMFVIDVEREINLNAMEEDSFDYYEDDEDVLVLDFGDDHV